MRRFRPILASLLVLLALPAAAQAYTFYEWDAADAPTGIVAGATGLTVTFNATGELGGVTLNGVQSAPRTDITGAAARPTTLVTGGDGNLWFVDPTNNKVGRTDPAAGAITLASPTIDSVPTDLVASGNNLMWVVERSSGDLDCIVPATGAVTAKASGLDQPVAITRSNDGALWFVDAARKVARLPEPASCAAAIAPQIFTYPDDVLPLDVTAAPSGNDVIVATTAGLKRITPTGTITQIDTAG